MAATTLDRLLGRIGVSASSHMISTPGVRVFVLSPIAYFAPRSFVTMESDADPDVNNMFGRVVSCVAGTLTVNVTALSGSGTHTDWTIRASGMRGESGGPGGLYSSKEEGLGKTASGDLFEVQEFGDTFTRLYKNVDGDAVPQDKSLPDKTYTDKILNNLEGWDRIGRPNEDGALRDGTALGSNTYFWREIIEHDGYVRLIDYYGKGAGTGYLRVGEKADDSDVMTVVKDVPIIGMSGGVKFATPEVQVFAGQYLGFYGPGLIAYTSTPHVDGFGYWQLTGNVTTSGAVTARTDVRLQMGFGIAFQKVNKEDAGAERLAVRGGLEKVQILGRPLGVPLVSRSGISDNTVVFGQVAERDGRVSQIDYYGLIAGSSMYWGIFDVAGDTKTIDRWRPIVIKDGENSVYPDVRIRKGQTPGYYAYTAAGGLIANSTSLLADDGYGAWNTSGRVASFDDDTLSRLFSSEIRFHLTGIDYPVTLNRLPVYKVFLCVVSQSNIAGRALRKRNAPIDGALMWSVASQSLIPLQDPTGTDATAMADNNGSAWPRFAEVFQDRTGYHCIVVNLAVGATHVIGSDWATTLRTWAATEWNAVVAAMNAAGLAWDVGGIISGIGEWDANSIDSGTSGYTKAAYKAAMIDAIENWARTLPRMSAKTPVLIVQTGMKGNGDTTGYQQVREAQRELVAERPGYYMGWSGAKNLPSRFLMRGASSGPDYYHYKLQPYDEMGQSCAIVAAAVCVG